MKKFSALLSFLILFTAFTCENEPLEGDFENEDPSSSSCLEATQAYSTAAMNFADATDENYTELCGIYSNAIQDVIDNCGDPNGGLQVLLNSLGDCENNDPESCESATAAAEVAQFNLSQATDDNYTQFCNVYKSTLENQIEICGDANGSIQDLINGLGDCTSNNSGQGSIMVTAGTLPLDFDEITVVVENNIVKVSGETSAANDYSIYFEVEEGATGADVMQNFQISLISIFYPSTMDAPFDFISNIDANPTGSITGTFGNIVVNADNGQLSLTGGTINVSY